MIYVPAPQDTTDPDAIRIFRHATGDLAHDLTKAKNAAVRVNRRLLDQIITDGQLHADTLELTKKMSTALTNVDIAETQITAAHAAWHAGDGNAAAHAMSDTSRHLALAFDTIDNTENKLRFLVEERGVTPSL